MQTPQQNLEEAWSSQSTYPIFSCYPFRQTPKSQEEILKRIQTCLTKSSPLCFPNYRWEDCPPLLILNTLPPTAPPPILLLGKHTDWNRPPWPGTIITICMSWFRTGGPSEERGTNKPPPTRRVWERSKGDMCLTTSQNPLWHPSLLNKTCTTRKDSWVRMIG